MKSFILSFALLFYAAFPVITASAQVVTSSADSGAGSLRDTIAAASPGDVITFSNSLSGQTITLTSGQLVLDKNLT
ncbi:MAG TPA: hypothetical protein VN625_00060, partial [Desulfuromonadaceae bacterium]|nr:hypothetical protein [Desulfuromonadaceae bacterium]